ncbi:MAG: hypothetical protein WBD31_17920 [Rubripirellula sp.]
MKFVLACLLCSFFAASFTHCAAADNAVDSVDTVKSNETYRYPNLLVAIRSWDPNDPIQTHKRHSSGSCSHGGTVGVGVGGQNGVSVEVRCLPRKKIIVAEVKIEPYKSNLTTKPSKTEIDVSDLRTKFVELAKDDDGRVYYLIVEPEIVEAKLPQEFSVEELSPFDWDFPSSPVILDDETYVGRIGMSGGSLAGIEISGVANLEFSLLPLKDAKPIGTLRGGILTINTVDNTIVISSVRNGAAKVVLDGPYKVWVRQLKISHTTEEIQDIFGEQLKTLQKRQTDGDTSITTQKIDRIKNFIKNGRPMLLGSSARDASKQEISE